MLIVHLGTHTHFSPHTQWDAHGVCQVGSGGQLHGTVWLTCTISSCVPACPLRVRAYSVCISHVYTATNAHFDPLLTLHPPSSPSSPHHFIHRPKSLKTFQAFSSLFSSSRQFEEGFLNDPLIIGSGVTLVFQLRLLAFLLPFPLLLLLLLLLSSLSLPVF